MVVTSIAHLLIKKKNKKSAKKSFKLNSYEKFYIEGRTRTQKTDVLSLNNKVVKIFSKFQTARVTRSWTQEDHGAHVQS